MSGSDEGGSSEVIDFLLYMFVLGPSVEWCLKSPRVNGPRPGSWRGIALATAVLACVATFKISFDVVGREPNHFSTLGVRVDAGTAEIKRAYKQISLKYHPDKNPDDKRAAEKFIKYQNAYEVLKDPRTRGTYNKFGTAGLQDSADTAQTLTSLGLFYVIWLVVSYMMTMGKSSEDGRTWSFSALLALAVFEYQTRILSLDFLAPIFPYSTVHEKVELLHKLYPPFMHGARMISQVLFMDIQLVNNMRLEELNIKLDDVFMALRKLPVPLGALGSACGTSQELTDGTKPIAAAAAAAASGGASGNAKSSALLTGADPKAATAQSKAQLAAEETAARLAAQGFQPRGHAASNAGASGAEQAAPTELSTEAAAVIEAAVKANVDAVSESSRNRDRGKHIVIFFVCYALFKQAVDGDLI